jgi:hypothetical protein
MRETAPGRASCGTCHSSVNLALQNELPRILHDIAQKALQNYARVRDRPPLGTQSLREQWEDARITLIVGRYNAAILSLSVFVESMIRELIFLKKNERFKKDMGKAILYCREHGLLRSDELAWLNRFREKVRNAWVHQDVDTITQDVTFPGWVITLDHENLVQQLDQGMREIREGRRKPVHFRAKDHPWAAEAAKLAIAERVVFQLYDEVWDFTVHFAIRHLKPEAYNEWRRKHGKADPR